MGVRETESGRVGVRETESERGVGGEGGERKSESEWERKSDSE